jgi:hypothetical protein
MGKHKKTTIEAVASIVVFYYYSYWRKEGCMDFGCRDFGNRDFGNGNFCVDWVLEYGKIGI